jgi:NAD(P)-dependent dehydrogenase (short-subunit alcohol dehydrogenase family)
MGIPLGARAVVTGAASGLGRALAVELAREKGAVVVADVDIAGAEATCELVREAGGEAHAVRCDVARLDDVEALLSESERRLGAIDLLVNNAGVAVAGKTGEVPMGDWEWVVGINLWGVIYGCHVFVPYFRGRHVGHVINVASAAGLLSGPEMAPYNVTKAGVVAMSETLAAELKDSGVGVTVLCPMFFRTNIHRSARSSVEDTEERVEKLMDRTKIQAPEVARVALAAARADRLYAVPHPSGRFLWRVKRALPELFHGGLVPFGSRLSSR